jgi:hypothetical protein
MRKSTFGIMAEIHKEVIRQWELKAAGRFDWVLSDDVDPKTGDQITDSERLAVLAEEFGELSREVCEGLKSGETPEAMRARFERMRSELVQVAACCVSWLEGFPS